MLSHPVVCMPLIHRDVEIAELKPTAAASSSIDQCHSKTENKSAGNKMLPTLATRSEGGELSQFSDLLQFMRNQKYFTKHAYARKKWLRIFR